MKRLVAIASLVFSVFGYTASAQAKVRVVASIETLANLAKQVGGDLVDVQSLSTGAMDPHFVEARPSLQVQLNRADLLVYVGLDLEIGWLPPLVLGSRNPKIQRGQPGSLDASQAIPVLDVPTTKVDRGMGDIHPMGNPHYWIPPENASLVAGEIADRLGQIDPTHATDYQKGLSRFRAELTTRRAQWERQAAPLRGTKVVTYHQSWSYLSKWLGLNEVGYIEVKPGIPPSLPHLAQLVGTMKSQQVKLVIMESFYSRKTATQVAQLAGAKLVVLPADVGGDGLAKDYFSLVDTVVQSLLHAR